MKLDPSIIALKDFKNIEVFRLKLARYSTANKALSINASEWALSHDMMPKVLINSPFIHNMAPNVLATLRFIHNMYELRNAGCIFYESLLRV